MIWTSMTTQMLTLPRAGLAVVRHVDGGAFMERFEVAQGCGRALAPTGAAGGKDNRISFEGRDGLRCHIHVDVLLRIGDVRCKPRHLVIRHEPHVGRSHVEGFLEMAVVDLVPDALLVGVDAHTGPTLEDLWCRLIKRLACAVDGVRPDRLFPRDHPGKLKTGPHMRYKRTA